MNASFRDNHTNRNKLKNWERVALENFKIKMTDKTKLFPCIPATIGFSLNQLRYGFIGDPRETETVKQLAYLLKDFTEESKEIGDYTSLIIFFQLPEDSRNSYTVENYEQLFWKLLSTLSTIDDAEWPQEIPTDPHDPIWEYCFQEERYFIYCATPAHTKRQSRHFDTMMLAITPRWVLQAFNKSEKQAEKIKTQIRKRLKNYDSIDIHPDLNNYGSLDNYEWRQYFLRDDDKTLNKCPFHLLLNQLKV